MAKSIRSKREKRLRAIRREIVKKEPFYENKEAAKLAAQEAALSAPKLPIKTPKNDDSVSMIEGEASAVVTTPALTANSMDSQVGLVHTWEAGRDLVVVLVVEAVILNQVVKVFNCPNLKEISLDFSHQGNDNTDLTSMVHGLGRNCTRLQKLHIALVCLSNAVVLPLAASNFRELRMLALIHGSEITDASVAAIATNNLELLDLSGRVSLLMYYDEILRLCLMIELFEIELFEIDVK